MRKKYVLFIEELSFFGNLRKVKIFKLAWLWAHIPLKVSNI